MAFQGKTRNHLVDLEPGFYVIRNQCVDRGAVVPTVTVGHAPSEKAGQLYFIGHRRNGQITLESSGEMAVAYVEGEGVSVNLTLFIPPHYAEQDIALQVRRIDALLAQDTAAHGGPQGAQPHAPSPAGQAQLPLVASAPKVPADSAGPAATMPAAPPSQPSPPAFGARTSLVHLGGHVEKVGDITMQPDQWLGNPSAGTRVEGFVVLWPNKPADVELCYGCEVADLGRPLSGITGSFVGSRGRGGRITSVWAELTGTAAANYTLYTEVVFARKGPVVAVPGAMSKVDDPTDYVVALRMNVTGRPG